MACKTSALSRSLLTHERLLDQPGRALPDGTLLFNELNSKNGKELFYLGEDAMMAVVVRPDGSLGAAHKLFDRSNFFLPNGPFQRYDVSADGKRLFMIESDFGSLPRQLNVILHWTDELGRRLQLAQ